MTTRPRYSGGRARRRLASLRVAPAPAADLLQPHPAAHREHQCGPQVPPVPRGVAPGTGATATRCDIDVAQARTMSHRSSVRGRRAWAGARHARGDRAAPRSPAHVPLICRMCVCAAGRRRDEVAAGRGVQVISANPTAAAWPDEERAATHADARAARHALFGTRSRLSVRRRAARPMSGSRKLASAAGERERRARHGRMIRSRRSSISPCGVAAGTPRSGMTGASATSCWLERTWVRPRDGRSRSGSGAAIARRNRLVVAA